MDCYYHGYSGGPGGPCQSCERENGPHSGYYRRKAERIKEAEAMEKRLKREEGKP